MSNYTATQEQTLVTENRTEQMHFLIRMLIAKNDTNKKPYNYQKKQQNRKEIHI